MRFEELDSLRGLAALTVFFSHSLLTFNPPDILVNSFLHFFWDGNAAVYLFFVLSGFCLSLPYINQKTIKIGPFLIRRFFRIYPAYIFSLFFALILRYYIFNHSGLDGLSGWFTSFWQSTVTWQDLISHLVLIGPKFDTKINAVIWTLVIELKMSVLMPFIILVLRRLDSLRGQLLMFLISYLISVFVFNLDKSMFLSVLYLFVAGSLLAKNLNFITKHLRKFRGQFSLVLLALFLYDFRYSSAGLIQYGLFAKFVMMTGCLLIISIVMTFPVVSSFLKSRPLVLLGRSSYSLYLIHFPLMLTVSSMVYQSTSLFFSIVLSLLLTVIFSYIIYKLIELPFIKMGYYFSNLYLALFKRPQMEQQHSSVQM